ISNQVHLPKNHSTMVKLKIAGCLSALILALFVVTSCEEENGEFQGDFRDSLTGTYACLETFHYFDPVNDTIMNWSADTISDNTLVTIEKYQDSSLNIVIGNYSFIATYEGDHKFTCLECNGPPDYADFFAPDSINIIRKSGVTNYSRYIGKKNAL
ncbi:MAG TPA: hypothetical protein PLJ84_11130, partial [Bacteroidales bacterium]|nr:hypothetical protein [Bacteroidales bacterium]HPT03140.1 hypothetical protein [Bacteroidales bacterium]